LASFRSRSGSFFDELKRRKVLQAVAGYAVIAWVVLQIGEVTFEPLGIPDWIMTLLIVAVIVSFPVVVVVAWFFDLTWKGFRRDTGAAPTQPDGSRSPAAVRPMRAVTATPSVAVLPFDDMSPEQDQAYLCDGIAEEILNRLAQIKKLGVASRTASFRFRGAPIDAVSVGRKLNVATVLEGSVRKDDSNLRITTQLINVADGFHLWSQSYDRKLEHIFEIEDEIATCVADALEVTLGTQQPEECCTTGNAKAYEYYLKGLYYFRRWGLRNVAFAIDMFRRAVQVDPGYARAWAALADSHAMTCMYWSASEAHLAGAEEASRKALALVPGLADVHVSRGLSHFVHRRHDEAVAEFETALRLDPDSFEAHYFYGRVRFQRGELQQAADLFYKAEQLRRDDFQAPILLRQVYHSLGRHPEALAAARRGLERAERHLELNPDDTRALNLGLAGLIEIGDKEKAIEFAERSLAIDGENPDTLYNVACGFAMVGEPDRALECLERASLRGMTIAEWAENDSDLASLHDDPRFLALIRRLKQQEVKPQ
jgi:TolB-like protein/Flp pilus assembly protein TadD